MIELIRAVAFEIGGAMAASFFLLRLSLDEARPTAAASILPRRKRRA